MNTTPKKLWEPSSKIMAHSAMSGFMTFVNERHQKKFKIYQDLYEWSIQEPAVFWLDLFEFSNLKSCGEKIPVFTHEQLMQKTRWFPKVSLNFAENLLSRQDDHPALIFCSEKYPPRFISYATLYEQTSRIRNFLRHLNLTAGDRVAAIMPNLPETVAAMLASTSLGAVWSACSPDFGMEALSSRFKQIEPRILFMVDGYYYKGKQFNILEKYTKLREILPSLEHIIIFPYLEGPIKKLSNCYFYEDALRFDSSALDFEKFSFNHPLYILYSSGTTGPPKCMVHGAGGTLLQHYKELNLHTNLHANDRIFFYTTTGWMMWNWLISGLALGATLILYDGAPFYPTPTHFFDLIDQLKITIMGVGAKWIESLAQFNLTPCKTHHLTSLRTILTTGSPLLPDSFDYVYRAIKPNVQLSSISGGSDIISCFALGNPLVPVYRGQLQSIGLGMAVQIWDEQNKPVIGKKGELVCQKPFPSMPLYFWNDPTGNRYQKAYFAHGRNVWTHGDFAEITPQGGMIIFGRSDATLNPRGIRVGTAEIYQIVKKIDSITDCLAVAQKWKGDERIILFVTLKPGVLLDETLKTTITDQITAQLSPYHLPAKIIAVPDLPRTKNGKLMELTVKHIIHNEPIKNKELLENPSVLNYFENLEELRKE